MSGMLFIEMVLEESHLCRCCNNDALISYYAKRVSLNDDISGVGSKSLSQNELSIRVLFWGLRVVSSVHFVDVRFPNVED
jgi:hypothetical protein